MINTEYYSYESPSNKVVSNFVSTGIWGDGDKLDSACSMGVIQDGYLIAGTVYHNYYPEEGVVELSSFSLSKRWLTKKVIRAMFAMPFDVLGCQLVVLRVSERNKVMVGIARTFGFKEVFVPRLRGRDHGEFIFTYTDDQWKSSRYYEESVH